MSKLTIARRGLLLTGFPALAVAQPESVSAAKAVSLFATGVNVGNGADLTEDTLQSYTLPANRLANVGDMLRITAGGSFAGTTDSKNARVRFGAAVLSAPGGSAASTVRWSVIANLVKTSASNQSYTTLGAVLNGPAASGMASGTATVIDTAPILISVTGQNVTSAVAGSITCQFFSVEFIGAP